MKTWVDLFLQCVLTLRGIQTSKHDAVCLLDPQILPKHCASTQRLLAPHQVTLIIISLEVALHQHSSSLAFHFLLAQQCSLQDHFITQLY